MNYREVGEFLFDVSMLGFKATNPAFPLLSLPKTTGLYDRIPGIGKYIGTVASDVPLVLWTGIELLGAATTGKPSPTLVLPAAYLLSRLGHVVDDYRPKKKSS